MKLNRLLQVLQNRNNVDMGGETEDEAGTTGTDRPVKKKMKRNTCFNNDWRKNENYSKWLIPTPGDPLSATCSLCSVKILVKH